MPGETRRKEFEQGQRSPIVANFHCVQHNQEDVTLIVRIVLQALRVCTQYDFDEDSCSILSSQHPPTAKSQHVHPLHSIYNSCFHPGVSKLEIEWGLLFDPFPTGLLAVQTSTKILGDSVQEEILWDFVQDVEFSRKIASAI